MGGVQIHRSGHKAPLRLEDITTSNARKQSAKAGRNRLSRRFQVRLSILPVVGTLVGLLINEIMDQISNSLRSSAFAQLRRDK